MSLILVFCSTNLFSIELKTQIIKLPKEMLMVAKDIKNINGDFYTYKLPYVHYEKPLVLSPKLHKLQKNIRNFLETLFYSYKKEDKLLLTSLFDKASRKQFENISKEKFKERMEVLKLITSPSVKYAFKYKNGIVISWTDPLFREARQLFIKKSAGEYKLSSFYADKDDHYFWNVNLYLAGAPFKVYKPSLKKSFNHISNGEKKTLTFKLKEKGNYLLIYKKDSGKINLTVKDNKVQKNSPIQDSNPLDGFVDVTLVGENITKDGKNEIFYVESTYPMRKISADGVKKAQTLMITKE